MDKKQAYKPGVGETGAGHKQTEPPHSASTNRITFWQVLRARKVILFLVALVVASSAVLALDWALGFDGPGVQVEAHGMLLDIILFGLILTIYETWSEYERSREQARLQREQLIQRYLDELDDYRGWAESEAAYRVAGIVRRLEKIGVNDYNLENLHLGLVPGEISSRAILKGGKPTSLEGANLSKAMLKGVNLRNINLKGANLREAILEGAMLRFGELEGAHLIGANLMGADLIAANLEGAELWGANLKNAKLKDARLRGVSLYGAKLEGTHLEGANLDGAKLYHKNSRGKEFKARAYASQRPAFEAAGADPGQLDMMKWLPSPDEPTRAGE